MSASPHRVQWEHSVTRRTMLGTLAGAAAVGAVWPAAGPSWAAAVKGRIKQSVCLWCYNGYMKKEKMDLDQFAAACAKLGLKSIELWGRTSGRRSRSTA